MQRLCVFLGSSLGSDPVYAEAARAFGTLLAARGIGLVYGGGALGLMGVLAGAVADAGGDVTGVIPRALAHACAGRPGLGTLHIVHTMHERKARMAELADGFVALPGGIGTLEELFEVWTWAQLGIHAKPIGLLDVADYWQPLRAFIAHTGEQGFMGRGTRDLLISATTGEALLDALARHVPQSTSGWLARSDL